MTTTRTILLVEDNETHAHLVDRHLRKSTNGLTTVKYVTCLADAFPLLETDSFDVVLLDLSLPDSPIHQTLAKVVERFTSLPVVVLTSLNDLDFATKAVQQGAQDYLVKTDLDAEVLERAIRYAIERKRVQTQLQQYATKLEDSNKRLENFAHTLAHEVRSPLTVISGCLQIINGSYAEHLSGDVRQLLDDSLAAIGGMTELVECLLRFSQSNSGNELLEPVELEQVFYHVYAMLRPAIKDAAATLTHDALPTVIGIEVQLRQLLQNLIVNAIKYRSDRETQIHVGCRETDEAWTISVADNGRGIAAQDQQRIFSAFTRLENTEHISGAGIGLAFCERIVENHHGRLWVESEPGIGSTFYFSLPKK